MLPLVELEQWYWGLEQRREFRQSMDELMRVVGVEGGERVDLAAMLWPNGDGGGQEETIFIFGERGWLETYFGLCARRAGDGVFRWRSLAIAPKEGSQGAVTIGGVVPRELTRSRGNTRDFGVPQDPLRFEARPGPMVVELAGEKGLRYDLGKWRVDLLVDMGWEPRLAIVKAILAGERY